MVYLTPAGTVDEGGVEQPAYLNIDALLLGPPAGALKGVIGEGYERLTSPNAPAEEDDFKFHGQSPITRLGRKSAVLMFAAALVHSLQHNVSASTACSPYYCQLADLCCKAPCCGCDVSPL